MDVSTVKKQPAPPPQAAKRPEQAHPTQSQAPKPKSAETRHSAEAKPPTPVVNTQGHTTGRLLNVTA